MSEKYYLDEQGLAEVANHVNSRLKTVTVMPQNPANGIVRLYVGATNNNFTKGHIYQYNTNAWTDITEVDQTFNPSSINAQSGIAIGTELDKKVDKVSGKGLSTNDFTDALKDKLDGIETGAQVNTVTGVKGDSESSYRTGDINITKDNIGLGNVVNTGDSATPVENGTTKFTTGGAYTELNKKVDKEQGKGLSTNDFTDAYKTKLEGIETGAEVNVQSDWSQTNNASDDFIKNKPVIDTTVTEDSSNLITSGAVYTAIAGETSAREDSESAIQDEIDDIDDRVSDIEDVIPNQASVSNQLADKDFVNSSIASNTANFLGTFESISDLRAYSGTVTNNDYAFVRNSVVEYNGGDFPNVTTLNNYDKNLLTNGDYAWVVNSEDNTKFDLYRFDIIEQSWILRATKVDKSAEMLNSAFNRYKATVSGSTVTWVYEYTLNNSSFTAEQWATINSGLTQESVASDISSAINDLDANSVGGSGKYISAISESDGIISATEGTIDSSPTQGSNNLITSGAVYTGLDGKVDKSTAVTGVKGDSESTYRTGNVNITKSNIGLGDVVNTGDSDTPIENGTTKFTTGGAYTELNKKVDKVQGKGLSTNDFTDTLKTKLDGIEAGAQVNTVTGVKGNSETTYRTGDINITPTNIGLGNVVDTGDSATPVENGITKFTTGGAYTELAKKQDNLTFSAPLSNSSNTVSISDFTAPTSDAANGTKGTVPAPSKDFYKERNITYLSAGGWRTPSNIAVCKTAASTVAKEATMTGFQLVIGAHFPLYLYFANTVANATLNVNSKGAKSITVNGAAVTASNLTAGWYDVLYNGTNFELKNTGTQYFPNARSAIVLNNYYTCSTGASTAAKVLTIPCTFTLAIGSRVVFSLTNANTAVGPLTLNVNGTGAKTLVVNGTVTSASSYTMAAATYVAMYDGTYWRVESGARTPFPARSADSVPDRTFYKTITGVGLGYTANQDVHIKDFVRKVTATYGSVDLDLYLGWADAYKVNLIFVSTTIDGYMYNSEFYKTKSGSTYSDKLTPVEGQWYDDVDTQKVYKYVSGEFKESSTQNISRISTSGTSIKGYIKSLSNTATWQDVMLTIMRGDAQYNCLITVSATAGAYTTSLATVRTGTISVANGGTGLTTMSYNNAVPIGNASTPNSTMQVVRTASGAFYATAQDAKPQFGTLPVAQGGTGQTTQANVNKAIIGALSEGTSDVTDGTQFVSSYASDNGFSDTNAPNVPYKRTFLHVWNYIKSKISSVLGLTVTNYGGTAATATTATNANNVKQTLVQPTTETSYYFLTSATAATASGTNVAVSRIQGLYAQYKDGSSSVEGTTVLNIGNNTATGTDNNQTGTLRIWNSKAKNVDLKYNSNTEALEFIFG